MEYVIEADNIKCDGCASAIRDALGRLDGVHEVAVEIETGCITVDAEAGLRELITGALESTGYPERQPLRPG